MLFRTNTNTNGSLFDSLGSIFNLKNSSLWRPCGNVVIVQITELIFKGKRMSNVLRIHWIYCTIVIEDSWGLSLDSVQMKSI